MRTSNLRSRVYEPTLENIIRPFLLKIEFRKYARFINSVAKASMGKSCPHAPIRSIENKTKILVIAPHPDDEVLGCGGTIRKYCQNGSEVKALFLTDGSHGSRTIEQNQLIDLRMREAKAGLNILGCDDLVFFKLKDSELRANKKTIEMTLGLIDDYHPDIIFVPFFLDNHPDHEESAVIVASALKRYKGPLICYCYEVWTALLPNTLINITDIIEDKIQAIEAHWSQISHGNLKASIIGLNSYRSIGLSDDVKFCEAFYRCSKEEFIKMVLK